MDEEYKVNMTKNVVAAGSIVNIQTQDANWLHIDNIYEKLQRPNFYDIGNTYAESLIDYSFMCKTEQVGNIFLLHLFVCNHQESSFSVHLSYKNDLKFDRKGSAVYLPSFLPSFKEHQFKNVALKSQNYLTTYNFTNLYIDSLKDRELYIAISVPLVETQGLRWRIIDRIKFRHDFGALLTDPVASDFTIESADGEKFKVHKILLVSHSEVFKAMLKEETAESQNNYVKLVDVGKVDLRCLLEFIYTGTIQDLENYNSCNLLLLADRYDLKGLRKLTQYALSEQLNTVNALEILCVADMSNSDVLKADALRFIKKNVSALNKDSFKEINNPDLMRELCKYLAFSVAK